MLRILRAESFDYRLLLGLARSPSSSNHVWDYKYMHMQILTVEEYRADYNNRLATPDDATMPEVWTNLLYDETGSP